MPNKYDYFSAPLLHKMVQALGFKEMLRRNGIIVYHHEVSFKKISIQEYGVLSKAQIKAKIMPKIGINDFASFCCSYDQCSNLKSAL